MNAVENKQLSRFFYEAEDFFFRSVCKQCLDFDNNATAYWADVNSDQLNILAIRKKASDYEKMIEKCISFFSQNNSPWCVVIPKSLQTNRMLSMLSQYGFFPGEVTSTMAIDFSKEIDLTSRTEHVIRDVNENLDDWMIPLVDAFKSTIEITGQYKSCHQRAVENKANFHHFSLYENAIPISSLTLSITNNLGRIDDVATLPCHQRRGFATQLIHYALNEAKKFGVRYCFLEASPSGLSVYQKIGFKRLSSNRIFQRR